MLGPRGDGKNPAKDLVWESLEERALCALHALEAHFVRPKWRGPAPPFAHGGSFAAHGAMLHALRAAHPADLSNPRGFSAPSTAPIRMAPFGVQGNRGRVERSGLFVVRPSFCKKSTTSATLRVAGGALRATKSALLPICRTREGSLHPPLRQ